jgi:carboxymethylenebutenolidase
LVVLSSIILPCFGQKGKSSKKIKNENIVEDHNCCVGPADIVNPKNTDASFMDVAVTKDFGSLHEEPKPFTLENPAGFPILFPCEDGIMGRAYLTGASASTNNYLIVIQEWWGLNDHIKLEAEKYHKALGGKVHVITVDLYDGKVATTVDSAQKYIGEALRSKRKENILAGVIAYAGMDANIYTVGWCFGGMMSLQTAINAGPKVKGCVMYYGQPEKDETRIAKISCDVLGIFGTQDRGIPNEAVDGFAEKMKKAGKSFELVRYDAVHAFANPSNPGYNKEYG